MNKNNTLQNLEAGYQLYKNNGYAIRKILDKGETISGSDIRMLHKNLHMSYRDIIIMLYSHGLYIEDFETLDYQLHKLEEKEREESRKTWS